jgi:vitamin B12/bleomycin/antimicrobial peptide transport system ATP-binding/permease protein
LLTQPRYAILDEATSALDLANEERLYQRIQNSATSYVSVGHRPSLLRYHNYVLELTGDAGWRLLPTTDYEVDVNVFS